MKKINHLVKFMLLVIVLSCKDEQNLDEFRAEEVRALKEYVDANGYTKFEKPSGMYYIEREAGTGDSIKPGDQVKIFYTGMFLDSTIFDPSDPYEPFPFAVGSSDVIVGMSEGVTYMKQGGKATFIIPSNLAYGATNNSSLRIPRFSTLIFDVELYKHYKAGQDTTAVTE